jgi:ribosomal protein S18 acetylase RimI-like enzyme
MVHIRAATRKDAPFLAWVEQEAARSHLPSGFLDLMIPDEAERLDYLERMLTSEARSFMHHSGFLVAEVGGRAAAALSGYEPKRTNDALLREASLEVFGQLAWPRERLAEIAGNSAVAKTCNPETPDDHWVVEWVATRPELRGRGLVSRLLGEILDEGRARGYRRAQISLLIGNAPAQSAYQSAGFRVVDEKRHPDFEAALGAPGIRRMQREL